MNPKHHKVFYGWWVVGACSLISLCISGVIGLGFTALFEPVAGEFGWRYAQISFATSLRGMEVGLLAPLMGLLVDRWGPKRLIFGGAITIGLGLMLLGRITSLGTFYGAFVLIGIGMSTCAGTVLMTAVVNWFGRRVATAIAITTSGFALGGLLVPLVALLIDTFHWRTAVFILGLGIWAIILPLSLLVRHKPEQYGYLPDGEVSSNVAADEGSTSVQRADVYILAKYALTSRTFWQIALAFTCYAAFYSSVVTHIIPYLSSISIARSTSSLVASATSLVSIGGRLTLGWLGDRLDKRVVAATGFIAMALGLLCFGGAGGRGMWLVVLFLILFGFGWGGVITMRASLVREYFGRNRYGTIHGFLDGITMLGYLAGPPLAGWVFDTWGGYQGIWFVFAGLAIVATITVVTIPSVGDTMQPAAKPGS